jgi:uncharacterized protein
MSPIHKKLYSHFNKKTGNHTIKTLSVGMKYTAVTLDDGSTGVAYTSDTFDACGPSGSAYRDWENERADLLLDDVMSSDPIAVSRAIALINALNSREAASLPEDPKNNALLEIIDPCKGRKIVMVGYFRPIAKLLEKSGVDLYICDHKECIGSDQELYDKLAGWAEALILTSASIVNGTFDTVLSHRSDHIPVILMGPTTPLVPSVFEPYDITLLAGTVPVNSASTHRVVRQGGGTRDFQQFGKKVSIVIPGRSTD